ncbi:Hypothetical predicted protein [Mytilus galloprovincialis]|uniref:Uncharacterized protein n=1 Tax=Mytilus galloprovincialis TaxID=29158 RepID=A0A8B6BPM4_MYTGA|nr:Hypothetical predicted protein [Mytilus galloprovincialis]
MELIKTKKKTLSDLNEKILESIEEEEDLDEEIEEVDRYELEIQIGITKIEKFIKEADSDENTKNVQNLMLEYQNSSITFKENKYVAKLPWKPDHPELPTNEYIARRRTQNVIDRLAKDPDMLNLYDKIIKEQEMKDFIEKVPITEIDREHGRIHYIPHHPVKKDSNTTPIRIVYDCSCHGNPDLPSLNDCLSSAPPILK